MTLESALGRKRLGEDSALFHDSVLVAACAGLLTNIRLELVDDEEEEAIPGTATEVPEPRLPSGH